MCLCVDNKVNELLVKMRHTHFSFKPIIILSTDACFDIVTGRVSATAAFLKVHFKKVFVMTHRFHVMNACIHQPLKYALQLLFIFTVHWPQLWL